MRTQPKDGGETTSLWMDTSVPVFDRPPPTETEICIIGAGIAGLTCAVELARQGARVVVIDDGPIGGGETSRTSAHLASAIDDRFYTLEQKFGADGAKLAYESHAASIDFIERTVKERGIECEFRRVDAFLYDPPGAKNHRELEREAASAKRAGLACEMVDNAPLPFATGPAIRFGHQAEFHPLKYLRDLAAYAVELGATIHTGVHAVVIEPGPPLCVKLANGCQIVARSVIDATNTDMSSTFKICLQQAPYRSYCIAIEVPHDTIPHALFWDTADPYHYMRVASNAEGKDVLIVGGEDHRTGQGDTGPQFAALEAWVRNCIPDLGDVVASWSGQVMEPVDGLAHIGRSPEIPNVYLCTGDSGNGLTHGTIAGLLIPQLIAGESAAWAKIYDPTRNHVHAAGKYIAEAAKSSAPYTDWLRSGDVKNLDEIPVGEGALVRRGLHLIAAYKDTSGTCHLMSATCPHLRAAVRWNRVEKSWDCPAHGSRFDACGRVTNGPAMTNLEPLEAALPDHPPLPADIEITQRTPVMATTRETE